jgi:hypothetical protein
MSLAKEEFSQQRRHEAGATSLKDEQVEAIMPLVKDSIKPNIDAIQ